MISPELQRIYAVAPVDAFYMEAISMSHSALPEDLHMTNMEFGFSGDIGTGTPADFIATPFSLTLPNKDTTGSQQLQITLSNVEQDIINDVERMARRPYEPVIFHYRVYIHNELNTAGNHKQQLNPAWRMEISAFNITQSAITCVASRVNSHNKPWPRLLYTPDNFPGIAK